MITETKVLLVDDHARILAQFPCKLVRPDIDCIDPCCAAREQNIGETTGRTSNIQGNTALDFKPEVVEAMVKLDPAARDPGMILAADLERCVVSEHVARLEELPFAAEH